ncbi:uncharacterized protein BDZ99DRAFT_518449 [Mytilinidion resinicola]|uniref:Uncharacterized protein n=1 Tax=Mytilinidion resinicola TaxID=574789 RepID=A0A6A6YV23_9PEZI|nr:uncharacterized protein BDZ99DRAFT_518449 [Mytilinidion resinicola]KAF2812631.1 hypothetical protein BDZ99DRAFT_518449 [Mytilinidion resinicola]
MLSLKRQLVHWLAAASPTFIALLVFVFGQAYKIHQHSYPLNVYYTTALGIATVWLGSIASTINYHCASDPIEAKTKNEALIHLFLGVVLVSQAEWIRLLLRRNTMFIIIYSTCLLNLPLDSKRDAGSSTRLIRPEIRSFWGLCFQANDTHLARLVQMVLMSPLSLVVDTLAFLISGWVLPKDVWQKIKDMNEHGSRERNTEVREDFKVEEEKLTSLDRSSVEALVEVSREPTKTPMTGIVVSSTMNNGRRL